MMRLNAHSAIVTLLFCALGLFCTSVQAQFEESQPSNESAHERVNRCEVGIPPRALTPDEGLAVIAAALDRSIHFRRSDCSHLVHAIYGLAGFSYAYASSSELYVGSDDFERISRPQPGDLVVWRGHVGIVVSPEQHIFFSTLRSGPGIDTYDAPHWKRRGQLRFYRYVRKCPLNGAPSHVVLTHEDR